RRVGLGRLLMLDRHRRVLLRARTVGQHLQLVLEGLVLVGGEDGELLRLISALGAAGVATGRATVSARAPGESGNGQRCEAREGPAARSAVNGHVVLLDEVWVRHDSRKRFALCQHAGLKFYASCD